MKLTRHLTLLALFLSVVVYACGQEVRYNHDRGSNFASYDTYQWVEIPGRAVPDPLFDQAIKWAVDEQLARKGLTRVDLNADLLVGYQAVIDLEKGAILVSTTGPEIGGTSGMDLVHRQTPTDPVRMLVLDVYDAARKKLIWRGQVSKTIDLKNDPDNNYKYLQEAMATLLKSYPPPSHMTFRSSPVYECSHLMRSSAGMLARTARAACIVGALTTSSPADYNDR